MFRTILIAAALLSVTLIGSDATTAQTGSQTGSPRKPPSSTTKQADQWALLIGVNDYPGEIQDLRFARDDARSIRDLLISSAGYAEDHVILLTDDGVGAGKATRQNIFDAIDKRLAPRVQSGHQVMVFLAGHGVVRGVGPEAKSYYLPVDVDARTGQSVEQSGIDMEDLARRLSALKASQYTVFVDACREDPFPGRGLKGNTMTDVMARVLRIVPSKQPTSMAEPPTSVIFYACKIGQRAFENVKLQHGVFTYYILRGLKDLASRPDGRVEAGQLAGYLRENVGRWVTENGSLGAEQTPTMTAIEVRGPVVVARISPIGAAPASTSAAPGGVTIASLPEGATVSINGRTAGSGPLHKELPAGRYTVRAEMSGFRPVETPITVLAGYEQEVTLTLDPAASTSSYQSGAEFEAQQLWPQAIASYQQALREDPSSMVVYERLGAVYLRNARFQDAVELMTAARQKFPGQASILAMRSRALSALELSSDQTYSAQPEPVKSSGKKDDDTGDEDSGKKKSGKKGGKKGSDKSDGKKEKDRQADEGSRSIVSGKSATSGGMAEALSDAEQAVAAAPTLAAAHLALGFAAMIDPATRPRALDAFVRASTLSPDDAEAYFGVGYCYRLDGQYPQAVPQFRKAIELRPDYYEAQRELAFCFHTQGRTDDAIRQYQVATSYRSRTKSKKDVAADNLALSALYRKKGDEVGGADGEQYKKAGKGYEDDARTYDPKLTAAAAVLHFAGLSRDVEKFVPADAAEELRKRIIDRIVSPFRKSDDDNRITPVKAIPAIKSPAVIVKPGKEGVVIKPPVKAIPEKSKGTVISPKIPGLPKIDSKDKAKDARPAPKSPVIAPKITVRPKTDPPPKDRKPAEKPKPSATPRIPITIRKNLF